MKISLIAWAVAALGYLSIPLIQESQLDNLFSFLAELPLLGVTIWLFLKLTNLHLETMDKLINTFGQREQNQRENHRAMVESLLNIIDNKRAE